MPTKRSIQELGFLRLDGRKRTPLFRQLYESLRRAILDGRLRPETKIPSSRDLMDQLGVSRTTIVTAIELLIGEGYLQTRQGSGTFVSRELPDDGPFLPVPRSRPERTRNLDHKLYLSNFGQRVETFNRAPWFTGAPEPFCPGEPALDQFPVGVWSKIVRRVWKTISNYELSYGESSGYLPLRKAIADYLRVHRGVRCEPKQVLIVNGTQQAVDVVARVCLNPDDVVLFENPGYINARDSIGAQGAKIVPMNVDESGAMIRPTLKRHPQARMIYVTPSHQFPLGVTMSLERRLELIRWAAGSNGLILEDDYDSEYRYSQQPIPSMQGLDESGSTVYIGSCSKIVFPALSMAYAIVPIPMISAFENALRLMSRSPSQIDQIVLSEFIKEGHFVRHLRRMRRTHSDRRSLFVEEIERHLNDQLEVIGSEAGLHCTALLKNERRDLDIVSELARQRIIARPLSGYYFGRGRKLNGLVLGFACATPNQIKQRVCEMAKLIR